MDPYDHRDGAALVKRLAVVGRKVESVQVELMDAVDRSRCYAVDGHASAKIFGRHHAKLSNAEAAGRAAVMKALRGLPALADAYRGGEVGSCQVRRIGRVYANKRVRDTLVDDEKRFIDLAEMSSFKDFDIQVGDWVRRVDEDGTADRSQRTHENRDAKIVQDFEGAWALTAGWGSLQGNIVYDILKRFIDAEFKTDWAKAVTDLEPKLCAGGVDVVGSGGAPPGTARRGLRRRGA